MASASYDNYNTQNRFQKERFKNSNKMLAIKLTALKSSHYKLDSDQYSKITQTSPLFRNRTQHSTKWRSSPKVLKLTHAAGKRIRSAVTINNNDTDVIAIIRASHEDAILTEFRYVDLKFYGASLYFPIHRDTEWDLGTIEEIIRLMKGEGLLLPLDSRARSKFWSDTHTNTRGRAIEKYITTKDLS